MTDHKDFFGTPINIGDLVIVSKGQNNYQGFRVYQVLKFTPKNVRLADRGPEATRKWCENDTYLCPPNCMVIVNDRVGDQ